MQKNIFIILTAISIFSVSNFSCNKEIITKPKEYLTTGSWVLTAEVQFGVDYYALKADCQKDDFESYNLSGKLTKNVGQTKCDPDEPNFQIIKYTLSSDSKSITIEDPISREKSYVVLELSPSTFKIRRVTDYNDEIYTYTKR